MIAALASCIAAVPVTSAGRLDARARTGSTGRGDGQDAVHQQALAQGITVSPLSARMAAGCGAGIAIAASAAA